MAIERALRPGRVDIWLCRPDAVSEEALAACAGILDEDDRERVERLVRPADRGLLLVSRAFVRLVLSGYCDRPAAELRFSRPGAGGPRLLQATGLVFSVSHTSGLVACAVAGSGQIGVDVERLRPGDLAATIGRRFFAPAEIERLHALPPEERQRAFFGYWVLKEAYAKARGRGIALGFSSFSISIQGEEARVESADEAPGHAWWLALMEPTPDHRLGLACDDSRAPVVAVRWSAPFVPARAAAPRILALTPPLALAPPSHGPSPGDSGG